MSSKNITIILSILAGIALFSYVVFAGSIASLGYELNEKNTNLADFIEKENDLIIELAETSSPTSLRDYTEALNLVEMGAISGYITTKDQNLGLNDSR